MDVTRLGRRVYVKIAVLRGRNARECHSEFVEAMGNTIVVLQLVVCCRT